MADLLLKDSILVDTSHGPCEIHLNFGSITKLRKEEAVDVLVVSAFPGDYSPTPSSVIGALKRELNISVRNLSKDKEEDHRRLFSCWWSKPLQGGYSFQKILCFEGSFKRGSRPPMVVGEVFRSLVSMCKEKDIKVIMPLLAAGDQGYGQKMMLRLIVETAIHWMRIGLPLKILKIVIFSRDNSKIDSNPLLHYFKELNLKWSKILENDDDQPEAHKIDYDVYLSFNEKNEQLAATVVKGLKEKHGSIKIYSKHQKLNDKVSWQDEIYKVMVTCARVITILTPQYLADQACLEQYNIALCCTRNMKRDYLAPFYIDSIDEMPTYMCLIQYIDCRPADLAKVSEACYSVVNWLQAHLAEIHQLESKSHVAVAKQAEQRYDVFISYSHQNTMAAQDVKRFLTLFHPDWNIFIDIAELQTGVAWQMKLYNSIEASHYVITLLSPPYLKSKVCQEEYNLASAMHADASYQTRLIPLLVESVDVLPAWCCGYAPIDCRDMSERSLVEVVQKIDYLEKLNYLQVEDVSAIQDIASSWRTEHVLSGLKFLPEIKLENVTEFSRKEASIATDSSHTVDIMLCFHESNRTQGQYLVERLQFYLPWCRVSLPETAKVRHSLLDEAALVVPLLSCAFSRSAEFIEELNIALCRQRFNSRLVLFPLILEALPITPSYLHLLWCLFSCEDRVWKNYRTLTKAKSDGDNLSAEGKCLDFAAKLIAFILTNPSHFQGTFKTIVSTEELRDSTLRLRARKPVDLIGYNPLYFEKSRDGHKAADIPPTVAKDLCHSVKVPRDTKKDKNVVKAALAPPIQEECREVSTVYSDDPKSTVKQPMEAQQMLNQSVEERSKRPQQPSKNTEKVLEGPREEEEEQTVKEEEKEEAPVSQLDDLKLDDPLRDSQVAVEKVRDGKVGGKQ